MTIWEVAVLALMWLLTIIGPPGLVTPTVKEAIMITVIVLAFELARAVMR